MLVLFRSLAAATAIAVAAPAVAQASASSASDQFGARQDIRGASFSPSGNRLAVVAPYDQNGQLVRVYDLGAQVSKKTVMYNKEPDSVIQWCDFASEDNLVCQARITKLQEAKLLVRFSRLLTYSLKDGKLKPLSVTPRHQALRLNQEGGDVVAWHVDGQPAGTILVSRDYVPEAETGSHIEKRHDGLGVEQVNLVTMDRHMLERARPDAVEYIADEHGAVRVLALQPSNTDGYLKDTLQFFYRPKEGGEWQRLKLGGNAPDDFEPISVDSAQNVAYGFAKHDGYEALYTVSLDDTAKGVLVLSHVGADVDEPLQIGNSGRVVGAAYATDRAQAEFFDPTLRKLSASLQKSLPGQPQVEFLDASDDGSRLLIEASSDTDPGMLYSFDKATHKLEELLPIRPELEGMAMGTMQAVSYPAADGTRIPGYLTLPPASKGKNLPTIVMPHGGPGARDVWGFDWLAQYFAHLGYAVLQPNFRGSAGYGSDWFQKNGFQSWQTAIGDVNDAGRWMVSQGIADPARLAIVGWSYGGYAALQSQVVDPDLYKAVVAIAPVTDLDRLRQESSGYTNFKIVDDYIGHGPFVDSGSPARHAAAFKAPVLLFHGTRDENVDVDESRFMNDRLTDAHKLVRYIEFPGLDHYLDDATQRPRMLREIALFLDTSLTR